MLGRNTGERRREGGRELGKEGGIKEGRCNPWLLGSEALEHMLPLASEHQWWKTTLTGLA